MCVLTPDIALLVVLFLCGAYVIVLLSSKVDGVDVDGRIDRCFEHKAVNAALFNGENQLERSEAGVPWRLWPYTGTAVV